MKITLKKKIILVIFIVILIDVVIGIMLFKNRLFSHLAIWKISEPARQEDFYWPPENPPAYFSFEPDSSGLSIFRSEVSHLSKNESNDFAVILAVAKYVGHTIPNNVRAESSLKWDSPEGFLRQIRAGHRVAHCFHYSILFSTYLSSLGIKSRIWALENERFNTTPHSVTEVYSKSLGKWVFIDPMVSFYVTENGIPLSLIEFRKRLLDGNLQNISVCNILDRIGKEGAVRFYGRLTKCAFLRADNDFINKYNNRYGIFTVFNKYIDRLPNKIRMGIYYLSGGGGLFIHYVDVHNRSLMPIAIIIKLSFYFFILSLVSIPISFMALYFFRNGVRSKKSFE